MDCEETQANMETGKALAGRVVGGLLKRDTFKQEVASKIQFYQGELIKLNKLQSLLENNPDFEALLTLTRDLF